MLSNVNLRREEFALLSNTPTLVLEASALNGVDLNAKSPPRIQTMTSLRKLRTVMETLSAAI